MKKYIVLTLMLFSMFSVQAQQVQQMSVQQAVDYAMQNATQVKNALIDVQIQKQTNREVTSAAFPQLEGTGNFQDMLSIPTQLLPGEFLGQPAGTYVPVKFGIKYNVTGGFALNQLLFDGQVFVGLQARRASMEMANLQVDVTKEMIKANVQKIYYQLAVGTKQMESMNANIDRLNKLLHDTKIIYDNGFAEKLDVDKVNVQLNNLLTERLKLQNQLDAGNAGLKFLMNLPQKDQLLLTDTVSEDMLKEDVLANTISYMDRKEYQLLEKTTELLRYNIKRHKYSYLPTLSGFANYSKNAQRNEFNFFNKGQWFTNSMIGLNLTVPIFDGFGRASRVEKARLEVMKNENQLENLRQSIDNDVEQARYTITSALVTVDQQKQNMELAEKVYNTTKLKYEQGLGSNQEIYDAQTELRVAQTNYYSAMYDAIIARIDFLKAIGKL